MEIAKIAVIGAGNGGCAVAGDLALAGFQVHLYERPRFQEKLTRIREHGGLEVVGAARTGFARLAGVTWDLDEALEGASHVFVVVVAEDHQAVADLCAPHLKDGQVVVISPGNGGSLLFARAIRDLPGARPDVTLVETLTLPYQARMAGPTTANIMRVTAWDPIATLPGRRVGEVLGGLRRLYPSFEPWENVLKVALSNLNIITHPVPMMMNLGRVEHSGGEIWLLREGLTPSVLKVMDALDGERRALIRALGMEAESYWELGTRVRGVSFEQFRATSPKGPPGADHRFLTENVPVHLVFMASLGRKLGLATPITDGLIAMASAVNERDYWAEGLTVERLGLAEFGPAELLAYLEG